MYYKLDEKYAFRGWKLLPFALRRMDDEGFFDKPLFLKKKDFMLALRCNGVENIDESLLDADGQHFLKELQAVGIIASSEEPMGRLEPYQRHYVYEGAYLKSVHWSITGKCNYRCRHCLVSAPTAHHPELPLETIIDIANQIARCGIRTVDITGGEPLVRKDFPEIVKALSERRITIRTLFTNTKLLTGELLDQIEAAGQHPTFQISYDGWECHDWLRGVEGAEKEARAACELLYSRGYDYVVAACVHKGNKDSLRPLWRYLVEHGCGALRVNAPQILGEWAEYADEYALSQEETWEVYRQAILDWYEDGMPLDLDLEGFFSGYTGKLRHRVGYAKHLTDDMKLSDTCYCEALRYNAYVSPEGRLVSCMGFSDTVLGPKYPSIIEEGGSLGEASSNPDSLFFKMQRTTVADMVGDTAENPECASCESLRTCLGGCMLEGTTPEGNHLHRDERCCWFFKNVGEAGVDEVAKTAIEQFVPGGLAALEQEIANEDSKPKGEMQSEEDCPC